VGLRLCTGVSPRLRRRCADLCVERLLQPVRAATDGRGGGCGPAVLDLSLLQGMVDGHLQHVAEALAAGAGSDVSRAFPLLESVHID
jgi:hypothetical protein